jgi:hypothetical protein
MLGISKFKLVLNMANEFEEFRYESADMTIMAGQTIGNMLIYPREYKSIVLPHNIFGLLVDLPVCWRISRDIVSASPSGTPYSVIFNLEMKGSLLVSSHAMVRYGTVRAPRK